MSFLIYFLFENQNIQITSCVAACSIESKIKTERHLQIMYEKKFNFILLNFFNTRSTLSVWFRSVRKMYWHIHFVLFSLEIIKSFFDSIEKISNSKYRIWHFRRVIIYLLAFYAICYVSIQKMRQKYANVESRVESLTLATISKSCDDSE